jgi:hypothetical protein
MIMKRCLRSVVTLAFIPVLAASCSSSPGSRPSTATSRPPHGGRRSGSQASPVESAVPPESPVAAESNPPGDIPDTTQFVPYQSAKGHFQLKVAEGWARRTSSSAVSWTDKLNTIGVTWFRTSAAPTRATTKAKEVPQLARTERAFKLSEILSCAASCTIPYSTAPISVTLAVPAVVVTYRSNSEPNSVTGKQYRLEDLRFEFYRKGEEVALTLSGPVGSDNVDPWRLVSESFRWR